MCKLKTLFQQMKIHLQHNVLNTFWWLQFFIIFVSFSSQQKHRIMLLPSHKHPCFIVFNPVMVVSRPNFAGLGLVLVSDLEISVSVSVLVLCSKGLGLTQNNLSRPPRPQKLCLEKWIILNYEKILVPYCDQNLQSLKSAIIYLNTLQSCSLCFGGLQSSDSSDASLNQQETNKRISPSYIVHILMHVDWKSILSILWAFLSIYSLYA